MSLAQYLRVIRMNWILVCLAAVLGGGAAAAYSVMVVPQYQADLQFFVSANVAPDNGQLQQGAAFTQNRVRSYVDIVNSPILMQSVIKDLSLPYSPEKLSARVTASSPPNSSILNVSVTDPSPQRAWAIADKVGQEFPRFVARIETPSTSGQSPVRVTVTRAPVKPRSPVSPRTGVSVAVGALAGLVLGSGSSFLRHSLDRRIRTKTDVMEIADTPVLGSIVDVPKRPTVLIVDDTAGPRAEAFRQLRTNIRFLSVDRQLTSFVVTGSLPEEGKTTTSANLAIALAQSGQPVVLVDADLRRPRIADVFALSNGVGLTSVLLGDVPVDQALQQWRPDLPLHILVAGPTPPNPSELLGSARLKEVIASLEATGLIVIFDSPPLLPVTDAALVACATGGALVVARAGYTRVDQLTEAMESLRRVGVTVLGVVVNRVKNIKGSAYPQYYGVPTPRPAHARR